MGFNTIVFSKDDAIATIQLNRPEAMNAINLQMLQEISTALDEIASDNNIRVLVLNGSDKVFAAGADIRDFVDYGPLEVRDYIQQAHLMGAKLNRLPKATIACMAGLALGGGCEIALGCDFRIAADNCKFGFPEINLGVFPAGGGTQRLARVVGCSRAKELILTGEIIDSQRAEQIGLVTKVVPADQLDSAFCFVGTAGHHAGRNYSWGFCYYNDVAMAVLRLKQLGVNKILILDMDPHSGDGTRDLIALDPNIIHINFFADEDYSYQDKKLNNYGILLDNATDKVFLQALDEYLPKAAGVEFIIVIFGHDSHCEDYGDFYLTVNGYREFTRRMKSFSDTRPLLYVLSGGSQPQIAAQAIPAVIESLL
jgi:enoyl-CoA hydratase/carnithine racemase